MNRNDAEAYTSLYRAYAELSEQLASLTACPAGHSFCDGWVYDHEEKRVVKLHTNVHLRENGRAECRLCRNQRVRQFRARRRAAQLDKAKAGDTGEAAGR